MRFENKVAVITGAAMGIGRAIAHQLASGGAHVVIIDINATGAEAVAGEIAAKGHKASSLVIDVTNTEAVNAGMAKIVDEFGGIDILIPNAGTVERELPVQDMPYDQWHRVMDVNLHAVFYCCRAAVPAMLAKKNGRIIVVTSIAGKEGVPNLTDYCAAKAGAIAFVKSLSREVARSGITVNAVTPGVTDGTDMAAGFTPEQRAVRVAKVPIGRMATTDEVAAVAVFLSSDAASFVTGAVYDVTGGRSDY